MDRVQITYNPPFSLMKEYIQSPSDYDACGKNARTYFKSYFTLERYMDSLEKTMKVMTK
jgi:hypothetical protein